MNFNERPDPGRRVIGFGAVILLHVVVVWALLTGLGKKVIEVVRAPIETKVIEEVKPPPPPPEVVVPPPPRLEAPPPPFIPPPEIQIATPPPPAPTITATTPTPPPAPVVIAPAPPQPVVAAPAPPAPPAGPVTAAVACSRLAKPAVPAIPATAGITGATIVVRATTKDGKVDKIDFTRVSIEGGRDTRIRNQFIANVEAALRQYECASNAIFTQEFAFKITD